jgi:Na+/H+ antiporter NhaD/arsenite permease-like protein
MITLIVVLFVLGYLAIALEHPLRVDKAAVALFLGVTLWAIYAIGYPQVLTDDEVPAWFRLQHEHAATAPSEPGGGTPDAAEIEGTPIAPVETSPVDDVDAELHEPGAAPHAGAHAADLPREYLLEGQLLHQIAEIASILFFLMGAMTIVELIDAFEGFSIITSRITTRNKVKLLWAICWLTFFMSAVLDNLTTTIVMVSLLKKLIKERDTRLLFVGMVIISANSGGAWTVIGDVTTTMLWIKEKITPGHTMFWVFLPSVASLLVPLIAVSLRLKGEVESPDTLGSAMGRHVRPFHQMLFFTLGFAGLLAVPIFKTVTHLPPFMGMMLSLSVMWIVSELVKHSLHETVRSSTHVVEVLKRIDTSSILFFLGILLAIGALASTGILRGIAEWLDRTVPNLEIVAIVIGLVSAVVDNVPLVAAGIEMYRMPVDDPFWTFLAYCAGTGGSCLIIGSAAGVAAMGLEKIDFVWYVKRITPLALLGYFSGVGVYLLTEYVMNDYAGAFLEILPDPIRQIIG